MNIDIYLELCRITFIMSVMNNEVEEKLKEVGVFRIMDSYIKSCISQATLSRWVKKDIIKRLARGIYVHSDIKIEAENLDYIVACARFGKQAVIGGLSALYSYGLIEQVPNQVWVVTTPNKKNETYKSKYRLVRTTTNLNYGIKYQKFYKITNIERTLIECMKFSTKIGLSLVLSATRRAIEQGITSEVKLGKMAKKLGLTKVLLKHWDAIV